MFRRFILLITFTAWFAGFYGQEILTGLQVNEVVKHASENTAEAGKKCNCDKVRTESVELPFYDDFSVSQVYPDASKWINSNSIFVNQDFPYLPPNLKAATFDAINSVGKVYENAEWIAFEADVMTSVPIRTDSAFSPIIKALGPDDGLYLSFFYQPQGMGDEPEPWDTLLIEFSYLTGDTIYSHVDSIDVPVSYYLETPDDTLKPGTIVSPPIGCDTAIEMINFQFLTWDDWIMVPCDSVFIPQVGWEKRWDATGMKLLEFQEIHGSSFVQVMLPIYKSEEDTVFFWENFQFRFRNYASIANDIIPSWRSNVDQWNVDYIYFDYNRTAADTMYRDLSFTQRAPSFLRDYQSMPYRQYIVDPYNNTVDDFNMYISNLDSIGHNSFYRYEFQQVGGSDNYKSQGNNFNVPKASVQEEDFFLDVFYFPQNVVNDTTSYVIKHYISDSSDANILVDSASYHQGFYNYFAYDDGTPEFGYGLEPAGAFLAYQFTLSTFDTLRGVQMYFNKTLDDASVNFFSLLVWKDNNGVPGELIYEMASQKPKWEDGLYVFYPYIFDEPLLMPAGKFYVGWQQYTDGSLNIGYDANQDYGDKIFFKIEQAWQNSIFDGSLLIRPVIGPEMIVDIEETRFVEMAEKFNVYPNPASTFFSIDEQSIKTNAFTQLTIYNIFGSAVLTQAGEISKVDISALPAGTYIVRINSYGKMHTAKLLINR